MTLKNRGRSKKTEGRTPPKKRAEVWQWVPRFKVSVNPPPPLGSWAGGVYIHVQGTPACTAGLWDSRELCDVTTEGRRYLVASITGMIYGEQRITA